MFSSVLRDPEDRLCTEFHILVWPYDLAGMDGPHRIERFGGLYAIFGNYSTVSSSRRPRQRTHASRAASREEVGSGLGNSPRGPGNWQWATGSNRQSTDIALKLAWY